jgi:hypothetical protein
MLAAIECRAGAEIVDHAFERLDLRGELAGRGAVAGVLDFERGVFYPELVDGVLRLPVRAQAHQDRQRGQPRADEDGRAQADRESAHQSRGSVGDNHRVAARTHSIQVPPSVSAFPNENSNKSGLTAARRRRCRKPPNCITRVTSDKLENSADEYQAKVHRFTVFVP